MSSYILDARTATPHYPGIGRYVRSLATAMAPQLGRGEQLTLLTDPRQPLHLRGVRSVPVAMSPFSLAQQWTVPALLRRLGATVYHSPYYLMPYLPGAPTLLTVYDLIPVRYPEHSSAQARLLFRWATRLALHAARHVISITETARQDFMAEFSLPPERITAIPLAANPAFQPQSDADIAAVREKYTLPERFVLYLGGNRPHKNLVGLVRAWSELAKPSKSSGPRRFEDAQLVIAGAWDERYPQARVLAQSLPEESMKWLGPVPESALPALYSAAAVFVFPSLFEGFGLPVIEAMACGTPVICSNVSALPEVAGDAAVLVDPTNVAELGETLARVLGDEGLRSDLRQKGLTRAGQFSWLNAAKQTLALYRRGQLLGMD